VIAALEGFCSREVVVVDFFAHVVAVSTAYRIAFEGTFFAKSKNLDRKQNKYVTYAGKLQVPLPGACEGPLTLASSSSRLNPPDFPDLFVPLSESRILQRRSGKTRDVLLHSSFVPRLCGES